MHVHFPRSLRSVENLLHKRAIDIRHDTVRFWINYGSHCLSVVGLAGEGPTKTRRVRFQSRLLRVGFELEVPCNDFKALAGGDGMDAALSPTASQCAKLVMLKSQEEREGIHEGS
jgi:hypothetical protein